MRHRIIIFIVIFTLVVSAGFLYHVFNLVNLHIDGVNESISELNRYDRSAELIRKIDRGYKETESEARSYLLTRNPEHLEQFYDLKRELLQLTDSMMAFSAEGTPSYLLISELNGLFNEKINVYDSLLLLNYHSRFLAALNKLGSEEISIPGDSLDEKKGNLFQKIFSSRFSKRSIREREDSLRIQKELVLEQMRDSRKAIRDEEIKELNRLQEAELRLVARDRKLDGRIYSVINELELTSMEQYLLMNSDLAASGNERLDQLRIILASGMLVLILLVIVVVMLVFRTMRDARSLSIQKEKADQLAKAREEFLAAMSHELRTPLSVISGAVNKLSDRNTVNSENEDINMLKTASAHLSSVVDDVLDNSAIDNSRITLASDDFSPYEVIDEVTAHFGFLCKSKGLEFNSFYGSLTGLWMKGDAKRLRQVLFNLLGNGVKFTVRGSVTLSTYVLRGDNGFELTITVSDTGKGIEPGRAERIFDRFESGATGGIPGTGLGLSICRKIVEQQGGIIDLVSRPGIGTDFTVKIPYLPGSMPRREGVSKDFSQVRLDDVTVLMAEDDPLIAGLTVQDLRAAGANVSNESVKADFISKLNSDQPDVLLMDLQLGDDDGIEILKEIRGDRNSNSALTPAIAVTANPFMVERALEAGFDHVLVKPVDKHKLCSLVDELHRADERQLNGQEESVEVIIDDFDLNSLKEASAGNSEFVIRMVNIFLTTSYAGINNLKTFRKNSDFESISKQAHKMAPSFEQMGLDEIALLLRKLETSSSSGSNGSETDTLISSIISRTGVVNERLKNELKTLKNERELEEQ